MTTPTRPPTVAEAQAALDRATDEAITSERIADNTSPNNTFFRTRQRIARTMAIAAEQAADTLRAAQVREAREKANTP